MLGLHVLNMTSLTNVEKKSTVEAPNATENKLEHYPPHNSKPANADCKAMSVADNKDTPIAPDTPPKNSNTVHKAADKDTTSIELVTFLKNEKH